MLAVALLPRLLFLGADPPQDMHEHFFTDEAWWAHNARNHALFGRWIMDDHNPPLYGAPLYTAVLRGVYGLLGTGLVPTRLLAALSGALACVVLYLGLRLRHPRSEALAPALLLAGSYFAISHGRVGLGRFAHQPYVRRGERFARTAQGGQPDRCLVRGAAQRRDRRSALA